MKELKLLHRIKVGENSRPEKGLVVRTYWSPNQNAEGDFEIEKQTRNGLFQLSAYIDWINVCVSQIKRQNV